MNLIDALLGEHAVIRDLIAEVSMLREHLSAETIHVTATLLQVAIGRHSALEDDLLFDRLQISSLGATAALRSMREEHDDIRTELAALEYATDGTFASRMERLAKRVTEHFETEERILFALASSNLTTEQLAECSALYARRRRLATQED